MTDVRTDVAELMFALRCLANVTHSTHVRLFKAELIIVHSNTLSVDVKQQRRHVCRVWPNDTTQPHTQLDK